jgi:hypothetical protein
MNTIAPSGVDRRSFLTGATATAAFVVSGASIIHTTEAWGYTPTALKPETFKTLIGMARDIYPHDRIADKFYAIAMKTHDEKAKKDDKVRADIEKNVAEINSIARKAHKVDYAAVGWERERVNILRGIQTGKFFQGIRGGLVVSLYNQEAVWPQFGYEGESAAKGGYIARGFNDIVWL